MTQWVASLISQIRLFLMPFVDSGFGLIYDRELNLSWLKDANYAKTVGRSPSGGMTWYEAMSWVAGLSYCGVRGWRLPSAFNLDGSGPCIGDNCTDNELGRLLTTPKRVSARISPIRSARFIGPRPKTRKNLLMVSNWQDSNQAKSRRPGIRL